MSKKRIKQYLMLLTVVGLVSTAMSGAGTFASFSAVVQNNGNTFTTGTLFLHQSANGGTTCASESSTTNDQTCTWHFNVDLSGSTATALLTTGISIGDHVTQLDVDSLSQAVTAGETVTVGSESFIASADAAKTDAVVSVLYHTATAAHSIGDTVTADPTLAHYATLAFTNAGSINAKSLSVQAGACGVTNPTRESVGTISGSSGTGPYTITVGGTEPSIALPSGALVSDGVNTFTTSGAVAAGAGSFTVTGGATAPANGTLYYIPKFGSTDLCGADVYMAETDLNYDVTAATACPLTALDGSTTAADCSDSTESFTSFNTDTATPAVLALNSGGNGNTGIGLDANTGTRYLVIGFLPPTASGNDLQNNQATFDLKWTIDQA